MKKGQILHHVYQGHELVPSIGRLQEGICGAVVEFQKRKGELIRYTWFQSQTFQSMQNVLKKTPHPTFSKILYFAPHVIKM